MCGAAATVCGWKASARSAALRLPCRQPCPQRKRHVPASQVHRGAREHTRQAGQVRLG
jgi:hypothetical protein